MEGPPNRHFFAAQAQDLTPEEREIVQQLLSVWEGMFDEALELLLQDLTLPLDFWSRAQDAQREVLQPYVERLAIRGVSLGRSELQALRLGVVIDWNLVNNEATAWARTHTDWLASAINQTTIEGLGEAIAQWIESGEAFPALREAVQELIEDPVRAEMIAITETTRAIAEGNDQAFRASGIWGRRWETAVDERVCPICGGLHRQAKPLGEIFTVEVGGKRYEVSNPPAHRRCRCDLKPVVENPNG